MKKREIILRCEAQRESLIQDLQALPLDKPFKVTIEPYSKARSLSQLGLYWKWIHEVAQMVADETGNEPDDIHEFFKQKFLTPKIIEVNGEISTRYTTTTLKVSDMSVYMTQVHAFVTGDLGLYVTLPEELLAR